MKLANSLVSVSILTIFLGVDSTNASAQFWREHAIRALDRRAELVGGSRSSEQVAKNVILFVGDGMGPSTVSAARVLKSQRQKLDRGGEFADVPLAFEEFPDIALAKTYNTDKTVPDSAATATAFLCGVKARYSVLGLSDAVHYENCTDQLEEENITTCIGHWAAQSGKSVGVVTTTEATHATPGPVYAHAASRKWQSDAKLSEDAKSRGCKDIARQFIENYPGNMINVLMGGGLGKFTPEGATGGERQDGRNLVDEWKAQKQGLGERFSVVTNREELQNVNIGDTDYLLGLYPFDNYDGYPLHRETNVPTLTEMVTTAIRILQKNDNGFFLLVEAGTIDWGHHHNLALRALKDVLDLESAVEEAMRLTGRPAHPVGSFTLDDTLIVVTADHSHPFVMAGYPNRNQSILEEVRGEYDPSRIELAEDGLPYTSFLYGGGRGYAVNSGGGRQNVSASDINITSIEYRPQAAIPMADGPHGGEDVAVYAVGAMSHLFGGVQEQSYLAHAMAAAACLQGHEHREHCQRQANTGAALSLNMYQHIPMTFATLLLLHNNILS